MTATDFSIDKAPVVLVQRRAKLALALVGCVAFVALGAWLATTYPERPRALFGGVLSILVFGWFFVVALVSLAKPAVVTISAEGLRSETAFRSRLIRWSDIEEIRLAQIRSTRAVVLRTRMASRPQQALYGALKLPGNSGLPGSLPISQPQLYDLLVAAKARWGSGRTVQRREPTVS